MGGRIHPGFLMVKHVLQWFWDHDWLGKKYKAIYFGPRIDWMKLFKKESKNEKSLDRKRNTRRKKIKAKS